MISVPGKINIRTITGRLGAFNVGTLDCSIGSFTVKDPTIDEFEEGIYEGDFVIEKIKPNSYFSGGRMVVEVRATLSAIMISKNAIPAPAEPESLEQDPLLEDCNNNDFAPEAPAPIPLEIDSEGEVEEAALINLFGAIWPLGSVVKLDPVVGRALLRQQVDYLKQSGYKYNASNQVWKKGE
jgi:hypothetical protein